MLMATVATAGTNNGCERLRRAQRYPPGQRVLIGLRAELLAATRTKDGTCRGTRRPADLNLAAQTF